MITAKDRQVRVPLGSQVRLVVTSDVRDPFRTGADLFGTAGRQIDDRAVSPAAIAYVQVVAIVLGHLVAVVLAHDRALRLFTPDDAHRTQVALGSVVVLFTGLAVFLLVST